MRVQVRFYTFLLFLIFILPHQTFPQTYIQTSEAIYPQFNSPVFENISMEDGLPENSVTCILQDYLGYLWLGTQNGLVRYDGYSMSVFQSEEGDSVSISGRRITAIFEDKNKVLWIGTLSGLNKFDRASESFKSYRCISDDKSSISSDEIYSLYEDTAGRFWVGTAEGLNLFDRDKEIFTRYYFRYGNTKVFKTSLSYRQNLCVNAMIQSPFAGDLFIGTAEDGLWEFNIEEKTLTKFKFTNNDNVDKKIGWIQSFCKSEDGKIWMTSFHSLSSLDPQKKEFNSYIEFPIKNEEHYIKRENTCGTVIEDQTGLIWCGFFTGEKGVFCLNPKTGMYQQYKISPDKLKHSFSNDIFILYEDRSGIIWIGTWMAGLNKFDKNKNKFQLLKSENDYSSNSLSHSDVYSVIYDDSGFMWFCTRNALSRYDIKTNKYKHYLKNENCITQSPYTALQDASGNLWLGTSTCGLIRFNTTEGSYRFYFNNPKDSINLFNKKIVRLFQDHLGFLWISTNGFGVYKLDLSEYKLTHYKNDPNDSSSLSNDEARDLYEDRSGTMWVGTNAGGLNKYDRVKEEFIYSGFNSISVIYEDRQGNFWVADYLKGLHLFDREKGTITESYNQKNGFVSNAIFGILEDDHNNLWLGTEKGLSKFNTITKTIKHYHQEDGLPNDWFEVASTCSKGPDEEMYFNTRKGLIVFHPDSIKDDPILPEVVLSGISLFNRPGEKLSIKGFISELKEITLPYSQNDLRFDFVGLHFSAPLKNKYKYILENFDNDWVHAGNQRNATYTNLDPGDYVFRVIASNRDGIWNEAGASLRIIILPPWWKTAWAYILYTFALVSILFSSTKFYLNRQRLRQKLELESEHAEKLEEISRMKSNFFTNISHEFRTPLTLILGPAEKILSKTSDESIKNDASLIKRNSNRLLQLVNQLLELSKLDVGKLKLKASPGNLISFIKSIAHSFESLSESKDITLKINSEKEFIEVYFDKDKMMKIISNLLSNSFKFTSNGGKILISISEVPDTCVVIKIKDTGVGIPEKELLKLFDRFYQVDSSHTREFGGTGIGLALTKELVELHHGSISVDSRESNPEKKLSGWTEVTITIPLGKSHLKNNEIITENIKLETDAAFIEEQQDLDYKKSQELVLNHNDTKTIILVVEDNYDMREYITKSLSENYRIEEAVNGEQGIRIAKTIIPDLIVTDLMMPKMDGNELTQKLKTDERTSHIPIIILTAKSGQENLIEGLEIGADEYLTKPFDIKELKLRISNLLKLRKNIQEKILSGELYPLTGDKKFSILDQKFIVKVNDVIEKHLADENFSIEEFGKEIGMSRSQFHRKLKALVGKPASLYLRSVRLNKAKRMLENGEGNISEISYETGFSSPSYFTYCFKEEFGYPPREIH